MAGVDAFRFPLVIDSVRPNRPTVRRVTQQGKREPQGLRERRLRVGVIEGDAEHLHTQRLEFVEIVARLHEVRRTRRTPVRVVELDQHHAFAPVIADPDRAARGRWKLEVKAPFAALACVDYRTYNVPV
jgi:hypothetical protein